MSIFIFIPAFLVFLYVFYKLVKDDYVFIRRNVSSDQLFDIAFLVIFVSLFISRLFFFILQSFTKKNIFLSFFSLNAKDFSLLGLVLGILGTVFLISKYKKLPNNHLLDFFSISLVVAFPVGFLSTMFFFKEYQLFLYFVNSLVYAFFGYYFIRYFHPKAPVFMLFFSVISLADSVILQWLQKHSFVTIENILLGILFFISLGFFITSRGPRVVISRKAQ